MKLTEEQRKEFKELMIPVMTWIRAELDPYYTITISASYATLAHDKECVLNPDLSALKKGE